MLIEFEVGNYKSFKSPVRLSMLAANPIKEFLEENTFQEGRYHLLRSAVVYGANASGKSNLMDAMTFMRYFVLNSSKKMQVEDEIDVLPFRLADETENAPSRFEICFLMNGRRYRYGFEADKKAVRKEWLSCTEKVKEETLFLREDDGIEVTGDFDEGKGLEEKTRNNALFLSVVAQFNGEIAGSILKWFGGFRGLYGLHDNFYQKFTAQSFQNETTRRFLLEMIRQADVGIEDFIITEEPNDEDTLKGLSEDGRREASKRKKFKISTVHRKYGVGGEEGLVNLDFSDEESEGTKKFFHIAGPLLDCLMKGYVVYIDELDAKLHPLLTKAVVRLFNSSDSNPKNAQLIFATHDTNILCHGKLRRDQIWFTEKTQQASTDLYSLAEIKLPDGTKVRNDADVEANYIKGRYGAIPFLGDMEAILKEATGGATRQTD